ncbi:right-handed parallel beta-helix repeat-containing protein [Streptacidiphilus sp. ASG 303]|uniref:right-handed parallel beta-helix repeat-containing protein n=1 Tax=Streptacidiphilus sp. ASG 303 TaxID=2896847 RepID=UPI001E64EDBB|nr:right-handed parallel beta-helix repeat-containing protein [Streptacidiphilus sp. ASG 303]MCD0481539.1 right-handed parallel beta-helix repeat-containing protein [Streptacidiphilus sp. ASG 303]
MTRTPVRGASSRRAVPATLLAALAGAALLPVAAATPAAADTARPSTTSPQTAEREAALVAEEDRRLIEVRSVAAVAPLRGRTWTRPYRLDTGGGYTLVLTQRSAPYTVADLLTLAPQTFTRQRDGSYLLTENLYLNSGAKLKLSNPGGLKLRLASNDRGFVSIVSFGGTLTIAGTPQAPAQITSWDPRTGRSDTEVADGRAYIRAIGGTFDMEYADITGLGFWSGRTGGLSLTGTDRPNTGNVETSQHVTKDERHQAKADRLSGGGPASSGTPLSSGDVQASPAGPLGTPDARFSVPGQSYVSAKVAHSTLRGNAFGLFISSANGVSVSDSTIEDSLEHGLVLHRFASSTVVERTTSRHNGGDGFVLARATEEVRISGSTAADNGGNGFTLSGQPLAEGPSASGESVDKYGSNSVSNSVARNNGHYGIEVVGGTDIGVQNNRVEGSDMGIVARQRVEKVSITGNQVTGQRRQGIAVRDAVRDATVTGNVVEDSDTAIYVRDSRAEVRGNTVQGAGNHGVSLVGDTAGSLVSYNVVAGVGPSAIDTSRSHGGATVKENQTFAWHDTSSFWVRFRHYMSPMTMLWTAILLLILFAALRGRKRGQRVLGAHPYTDKRPLGGRSWALRRGDRRTSGGETGPAPAH